MRANVIEKLKHSHHESISYCRINQDHCIVKERLLEVVKDDWLSTIDIRSSHY